MFVIRKTQKFITFGLLKRVNTTYAVDKEVKTKRLIEGYGLSVMDDFFFNCKAFFNYLLKILFNLVLIGYKVFILYMLFAVLCSHCSLIFFLVFFIAYIYILRTKNLIFKL